MWGRVARSGGGTSGGPPRGADGVEEGDLHEDVDGASRASGTPADPTPGAPHPRSIPTAGFSQGESVQNGAKRGASPGPCHGEMPHPNLPRAKRNGGPVIDEASESLDNPTRPTGTVDC